MEENKGLNVTPVNAAATDPAALPGLVLPPPDDSEEEKDKKETTEKEEATAAEADVEKEDAPEDAKESRGSKGAEDAEDAADAEASADTEASEEAEGAAADTADGDADEDTDTDADTDKKADDGDGPVFEAADRRGSVTVDSTGVRFQLDDTEAEFTWPEIGAVEYKTSRFGRRLVLSVHDSRGICPAEVEAPDKATLKAWATDLEQALDAYFEEASP
ncbi:hypothetical protein [Streptomyces sp. 184]|uniref:hypothetical protein n=1 Tax=Streptomyces sp. 184 TaxID=1827526 RepID=UPI0038915A48